MNLLQKSHFCFMKINIKKITSLLIIISLCNVNFAASISSESILHKKSTISEAVIEATVSNVTEIENVYQWPTYNGSITSDAAFVMDADSGIVLYDFNAKKKMYPASLTKIMTAIIVLDKLGDSLDDMVTFSYSAVTKDLDKHSATIGASAGDQLSVKDCLYSLLLPSANDVANALAEHIAGSSKDFALLMNEKALNLGITHTHFVNPSGLHNDNQYTTAEDVGKMMQYAIKNPLFLQISSSVSYRHAPIKKYKNPENSNNQVLNTNSIMVPGSGFYYNGITAGKTGHTDYAGYNLAASAKKDNMHLICVTLGGKSEKQRFIDTKNLFDFYFNNYVSLSIKDIDERFTKSLDTLSINDVALVKTLDITCDDKSHITLPKGIDITNVESNITYQVKDIYNRYAIGHVTYYLGDKVVGSCTLEGRNAKIDDLIYTDSLNVSKSQDDDDEFTNQISGKKNAANTNALIYRNQNGALVISHTLFTMFVISIICILLILIYIFIYNRVLTNANFSISKLKFKLKRFFKHK